MAYDLIELPDPFRSDWRTAYLISVMVQLLGSGNKMTVADIHKDMSQFFDVCPKNQDEADMKSALKAWFPLIGAKKVRGPDEDIENQYQED